MFRMPQLQQIVRSLSRPTLSSLPLLFSLAFATLIVHLVLSSNVNSRTKLDNAASWNNWKFDLARDELNYGLSPEQCSSAFPNLYAAIDKNVMALRGNITFEETLRTTSWPECRILLYDNQLYILEDWPLPVTEPRKFATLQSLYRAILAVSSTGYRFPNVEFSIVTGDFSADTARPCFAYDRKIADHRTWLMPDFGFYAWSAHNMGSWAEMRQKIREVDVVPFEEKIPKLVWRGTLEFGHDVRQALVNASQGRAWSDVEAVDYGKPGYQQHMVAMQDHCKYKYVAYTEGRGWSGRLKYLHACESVIIAHKPEYATHDQHLMIDSGEDQNFVSVERDFSDLHEKMEWLIAHPADAARIARNNANVFRDRYLTPAAEACYWRKLIVEYARVSFSPEFYEVVEDGRTLPRGMPYEAFSITRSLEWEDE